eukprot:TRINITY_DN318_c0_g1_i1.p1 TRINITY_DN318_c0_g1~~TRINITY_DN318_c0_g1_i1.p1  ORF type:complete len:365 (+),score=130.10 TRINITY_DN318_c0_g1_i1:89-1096(+)
MLRVAMLTLLAAGSCSAVKFLSIGDWGDSGAKSLNSAMGNYSPDFVLAIGDNFYDKGVSGVDDPQFKDKFEDTFTAPELQNVPWYVCAGNHDYYGGTTGVQAEMEYSKKSNRWTYPSWYFTKDITGADGTKITIASIDTWRLNGGDTYVLWNHKLNTGVLRDVDLVHRHHKEGVISTTTRDLLFKNFKPQDSAAPLQETGDDEQLQWLAGVLANSTADWKLVMGHFPVHSASFLEHGDTASLIKNLEPVLQKGGVAAYFSGHDHILQHIQLGGVNYVGSGAGARKHTGTKLWYKGLKGHTSGAYGFTAHVATKSYLSTAFVDHDGKVTYSFNITK